MVRQLPESTCHIWKGCTALGRTSGVEIKLAPLEALAGSLCSADGTFRGKYILGEHRLEQAGEHRVAVRDVLVRLRRDLALVARLEV